MATQTTLQPAPLSAPRRGAGLDAQLANARTAYLYVAPAMLVMAIVTFYPILFQIYMAFTNYGLEHLRTSAFQIFLYPLLGRQVEGNVPTFVGVKNFIDIVASGLPGQPNRLGIPNYDFARLLSFNLVWTAVNVALHVAIGVAIALALNVPGLWLKRIYRSLFIIPWALPSLVVAAVWKNMFDAQFGMINQLWRVFGGPQTFEWFQADVAPFPFYPPLPRAFWAILITNVWLGWPFMMTVATGALQSIPADLYEAAAIDGASAWQKFWAVTAPLLRPAMVPAIIIGITMTFNQFNVVYFISEGAPFGKTEILVTQAYKLVNPRGEYGRAAAFSFIIFAVLAIITLITNRVSRATESYDA